MQKVGAYEAKTHLPRLLERVFKGERITITKHGVPIAVLQPPDLERSGDTESIIRELRKFRDQRSLDGIAIRDMMEEGRR